MRDGSSPLARGLPDRGRGRAQIDGIIPARAGFTDAALRTLVRAETGAEGSSPLARGLQREKIMTATIGSSPLARGLPVAFRPACDIRGIIPARAGFTSP